MYIILLRTILVSGTFTPISYSGFRVKSLASRKPKSRSMAGHVSKTLIIGARSFIALLGFADKSPHFLDGFPIIRIFLGISPSTCVFVWLRALDDFSSVCERTRDIPRNPPQFNCRHLSNGEMYKPLIRMFTPVPGVH